MAHEERPNLRFGRPLVVHRLQIVQERCVGRNNVRAMQTETRRSGSILFVSSQCVWTRTFVHADEVLDETENEAHVDLADDRLVGLGRSLERLDEELCVCVCAKVYGHERARTRRKVSDLAVAAR